MSPQLEDPVLDEESGPGRPSGRTQLALLLLVLALAGHLAQLRHPDLNKEAEVLTILAPIAPYGVLMLLALRQAWAAVLMGILTVVGDSTDCVFVV